MTREALSKLDAWFETMRGPDGYGGPVAHWWQNCLQFTGAGLDWRCEGLILGYLTLYERMGQAEWLAKARFAADDLVSSQLAGGAYRNSSFELNPYSGGTPHEAAADLALLHLAEALRKGDDPAWRAYLQAAERNLRGYYVERLWDAQSQLFRDHPRLPSFVPNKSATLTEALLKMAALSGDEEWAETYARPTLQAILAHQVSGGTLDGAIAQSSHGGRVVPKYFPYYNARCVPGLVAGYEWSRDERLLDAARRAMAFCLRQRYEDGSFPQVVYVGGRLNRYPQWIAAVGDILRAMDLLRPHGLDADPEPTHQWLLQGQMPNGAFRTAHGFGSQISQRPPGPLPEFRDLLPVCGWADKAFRWLAGEVSVMRTSESVTREAGGGELSHLFIRFSSVDSSPYEAECTLRGERAVYREDEATIELLRSGQAIYRWRKGKPWAEVCAKELLWK